MTSALNSHEGLFYFSYFFAVLRNLRPSVGRGSPHGFEAPHAHLVVVWHPIQRLHQVCGPFEDDLLSRKKNRNSPLSEEGRLSLR